MASIEVSLKDEVSRKFWGLFGKFPWVDSPNLPHKVTREGGCELYSLDLVSLKERVEVAFEAIPLDNQEKVVIEALMRHPKSSSAKLSKVCGWSGPIWHVHLGVLCQRRIDWLLPVEFMEHGESSFVHGILVEYLPDSACFKFKLEVLSAFRSMGLGK